MGKNEIVLFESSDGVVSLPVSVEADTVWLNILQMAALFSKDRSVILRHIHNAINEGEVDPKVTCAKFAQVTPHLVTKNHGFSDGNKRIAAGLFLYFLKRNKLLLRKDGSKRIADHTLVALTVMIAESKPQEKGLMVNLVMTFLK